MNKTAVSKELLVQTAKKIIYEQGLEKLSIRRLAAECDISVGSVYNYFESKADLIFAVFEDFWQSVYHEVFKIDDADHFLAFFITLYDHLYRNLKDFETSLLGQVAMMNAQEREKGRQIEIRYHDYAKEMMRKVLDRDTTISPHIWDETFNRDDFIRFTFINMMTLLRRGARECPFLVETIRRLLYS